MNYKYIGKEAELLKRRTRKSNLSRKATTLKRTAKGTAKNVAGFVPGVGTALAIRDTAISARKTVRATDAYLNALSKDVKRRIKKYI
jgi:hypothetical protein